MSPNSNSRFAAQYYAVHQNVRGMIPIHAICANAHPRESLAWYLCYRYLSDRTTCEMISAAMGYAVSKPELPEEGSAADAGKDVLARGGQMRDVTLHIQL